MPGHLHDDRRKASPNPEVKAIIEQSRQQAGLIKAGISIRAFGPQARLLISVFDV